MRTRNLTRCPTERLTPVRQGAAVRPPLRVPISRTENFKYVWVVRHFTSLTEPEASLLDSDSFTLGQDPPLLVPEIGTPGIDSGIVRSPQTTFTQRPSRTPTFPIIFHGGPLHLYYMYTLLCSSPELNDARAAVMTSSSTVTRSRHR